MSVQFWLDSFYFYSNRFENLFLIRWPWNSSTPPSLLLSSTLKLLLFLLQVAVGALLHQGLQVVGILLHPWQQVVQDVGGVAVLVHLHKQNCLRDTGNFVLEGGNASRHNAEGLQNIWYSSCSFCKPSSNTNHLNLNKMALPRECVDLDYHQLSGQVCSNMQL